MQTTHSYEDITTWFFDTLGSLLQTKAIVTIGLAGGTSFDQWYAHMLASSRWASVDTQRIRWCVTDERVNCDIAERNDAHIWDVFMSLLCQKSWSQDEYFIRPTMESNGKEYTQRILQSSNPPYPPLSGGLIDIGFFGMGPDGHTASLFPHSKEISEYLAIPPNPPLSRGQNMEFIKIENAPKPPPERISLSPKSIQSLTHTCLFAVGSQKKEALASFLDDSVSVLDCPVKLLKPEILLDLTD